MNNVGRSVLKTTSLPRYCETLITGFVTCMLAAVLALVFSSVGAAQSTTRNSTPDPYFNQSTQMRAAQANPVTPNLETTKQFSSQYAIPKFTPNLSLNGSANGTTPPTRGQVRSPKVGATEIWDAPLTPISTSGKLTANPPTSTLTPIAQAPGPSDSIIREPQAGFNNFSGQGFALDSTSAPNNDSIFNQAPKTLETPHQRPPVFENSSSTKASQTSSGSGFSSKSTNDFQMGSSSFSAPIQPAKKAQTRPYSISSTEKPAASLAKLQSIKTQTPVSTTGKAEDFESFEPGKVLALVGGEPIFVGDLLFDINQVIEKFLGGAPEHIKEQERQKMIPQLLPRFVESKLLYHGMLRQLPDEVDMDKVLGQATEEFDEKALKPMLKNSGLKSATEFDAHLRAQGSSLRNLRQSWARDQLTKYFLAQQLNVKSEVTHQQMLDVYRKNIDSYAVKAKVRWEQVMIRFDRSSSREEAHQQIVELGNQLVYGANLSAVAKKNSHGFMASAGGQQDWTSRGALVLKEIDHAIFTLPVGDLSEIIESKDGYHIIRVLERTEDSRTPFLEAQVDIKEKILNENRKAAYDKHITKLRDEIPVEYMFEDPTQVAKIKSGSMNR